MEYIKKLKGFKVVYFQYGEKLFEKRDGYLYKFLGFYFVVFKEKEFWSFTEYTTGLRISTGKTKKESIKNGVELILLREKDLKKEIETNYKVNVI